MGWQPQVDKETGIRRLWEWVSSNKKLFSLSPGDIDKHKDSEAA
jgi:dTDP-D-glucose 4,6-dehydratase